MNLLEDYREQGVSQGEFEPPRPQQPIQTDDLEPPTVAPPSMSGYDPYSKRKKSSLMPFVLIVVLVAVVGGLAYWGLFRDDTDLDQLLEPESEATITETESSQPEDETRVEQEPVESTQTPEEMAQQPSRPEPTAASRPKSPIPSRPGGDQGLAQLHTWMGSVLDALPQQVTLSTLIMDESSFSVEVTAERRAQLELYFTNLKESMGESLSMAPSPGTGVEARALITNVFEIDSSPPMSAGQNASSLLQTLREQATSFNLAVQESTIGQEIQVSGRKKMPLFFKVLGPTSQCREFLGSVAQQNYPIAISKLILMPKTLQQAEFVLRFELVTAL